MNLVCVNMIQINDMKYQIDKLMILLDNTTTQPSKVGNKNWVEVSDNPVGTHNSNKKLQQRCYNSKIQC